MNVEYTGRNCRVDDRLRSYAKKKLQKVLKFIDEPVEIRLILEVEKRRRIAELHISHRHGMLQATEEAEEMRDAIHAAIDKVEKQARRSHKKHTASKRRAHRAVNDAHWPLEILEPQSISQGNAPKVIRTTRLPIKPMTIDEAALQLEDSKNEFFVFLDSSTDRVSVLYKRRDDHYGLIAPEL